METRTGMMPVCGAFLLCILAILSIRAWQGADLATEFRGLSANFSFQDIDNELAQVRNDIRGNLGFDSDLLDEKANASVETSQSNQNHNDATDSQSSLNKLSQSRHMMFASRPNEKPIETRSQEFQSYEDDFTTVDTDETIHDQMPEFSDFVFPEPNMLVDPAPRYEGAESQQQSSWLDDRGTEINAVGEAADVPEFIAAFANPEPETAFEKDEPIAVLSRPSLENPPHSIDVAPVTNLEMEESTGRTKIAAKPVSKVKSPPSTFAWTYPTALADEVKMLYRNPLMASWAHSTVQILNGMEYLNDLADEDVQVVFQQLSGQVEQLDFLTMQASTIPVTKASHAQGELATQLRQIRYSIVRRLQLWPVIHELAKRQVERIGSVNHSHVGQFLLASKFRLNTEGVEKGWAEYLKLSEAASVFNSLNANDFARKKAARQVLARLYSPSLNRQQNQYLRTAIDDETINVLRVCSTDAVDLEQLVKRIEKFEANNNGASQFYVNDTYQSLLWSSDDGYQQLAQQLQTHYRNANFRVSVSERLLNRMMPQKPEMRQPYRDNIMGAEVVGQNRITNQVQISLIPDPEQISMKLETFGKVDSRTTASRSGIVIENEGTSRFRIIKRLAFGQQGIFAYRPQTTSQVAQRVVGLRSNLDRIPPLGWMARRIAQNKIAEQAPATRRYAQQQLESQAEDIFNQEVEHMLNDLETSLTENLLHPLIAMDLEPDPVQISTTAERVNMRYRLAGRDQMAANTARPRGVKSSLLSMQIHQSAINNTLSRFDLAGRKFTTEELVEYVNGMFGDGFVQLDGSASQKPARFEFAPFDPVRIEFEEQKIAITINLKSFQIGKGKRWKNLVIKSTYDPHVISGFNIGMVQSDEGLRIKGRRLNVGDQLAIGVICEVLFPEQLQMAMMPAPLANQLRLASAETSQFVVSNGWIGMSVDDGSGPYSQNYYQAEQNAGQPSQRR